MKKIILTIALAISSAVAFGQKTVDWSVDQILKPTELQSTQAGTTTMNWDVVLKNNGPDTVLIGDSIWFQFAVTNVNNQVIANLIFPGPATNNFYTMPAKKNMASGDTMHWVANLSVPVNVSPSANVKVFFTSHVTNRVRGLKFETTQTNNILSSAIVWYNWQKWAVNVNSLLTNNGLNVYPNPAKDNVNINLQVLESNSNVTVNIVDMLGKVVMTESFNPTFENISMNTSNLNKGVYIVKVINGNSISSSKLIIE